MAYPSNSKNPPPEPERKVVEKVVTGRVIRKKRGLGTKFAQLFIGGDAQNVWQYIAMDVMVPAAKDMVSDAVSQGIERMLFGESFRGSSRRRGGSSGGRGPGYTDYNRMSSPSRHTRERESGRSISRHARANHDFDEIVLATRIEAETVLERMDDLIDRYGVCSVSDMYDLVDLTGDFTDEKWGWTDLRDSGVRRDRDGYVIKLPPTEPIKRGD